MKLTRCKKCGYVEEAKMLAAPRCSLAHDFETVEVFTEEEVRERLLGDEAVTAATGKVERAEAERMGILLGSRPGEFAYPIDRRPQTVASIEAALATLTTEDDRG